MKNKIILCISRGRSHLDIMYKGEKIGEIKVSNQNKSNQISLALSSDAEVTRFTINKEHKPHEQPSTDVDESRFNREEFNR